MKKAFDQTVRDLKREVNKKVLKVPGIEQKILDATSNEPWGPHGSHLADIAQATRNYHEYQMIMHVIWKRLNDTGKNWRHVYKALTVLEYLVGHGSERVIDEIREHAYQIQTLSDFQYIDSSGKDQGSNVRRKSQSLVALVNDKEKIQEVRQKAAANSDKYRSTYSTGGRNSYSGAGGYTDRYDDDRSEGRYRDSYEGQYRDEDRNGYGRERNWGSRDDERYGRGGDSYNRDGDRYGRDSDERYGRDNYRDDDYRGGRGSDDHQFGPRNRSFDRDRDRFYEDDDRYSSRRSGGRADEPSQDERRFERKLSEQSPPPSYEESVKDTRENVPDGRGDGNVGPSVTKAYSPPAAKASSPASIRQDPKQSVDGISASAANKEGDEFDPRGSVPAPTAPTTGAGIGLFGNQSASDPINSLALVPVSFGTTSEADVPENSGVGTNFVPLSAASTAFSQPSEDPFGDGPFKATTQDNFQAQQQGFAPVTSFQSSGVIQGAELPAPLMVETAPTFDFGDPLGGLTYTPAIGHQQFASNSQSMAGDFSAAQANNGFHSAVLPPGSSGLVCQQPVQQPVSSGFIPQQPVQQPGSTGFVARQPVQQPVSSGFVPQQPVQQPAYTTNMHTTNVNYLPQSGLPTALAPQPAAQPVGAPNLQTTPINHLTQPGFSSSQSTPPTAIAAPGQPAKAPPPKDKFETKSTVWADTLNRGLVNLNISGAKVNPLADIGVDFDTINRMEKRKEKSSSAPVTSTITMGKAMGSGSGIGKSSAGRLTPPSNPMMGSSMGVGMGAAGGMGMGMGMGAGGGSGMGTGMGSYGGGMNQPTGIGMGMNRGMGMGMGMNMGMNQATQMRPPAQGPGMPGVGYNPMMGTGMGGYGSQQPYVGGYGSQQPYGSGYR